MTPDSANHPSESPLAEIPITPPARDPAWGIAELLLIALFMIIALLVFGLVGPPMALHLPVFRGLKVTDIASRPLFLIPAQAVIYLVVFLFTRMLITVRAQQDFWVAIKWNLLPVAQMVTFCFTGIILALTTQVIGHFLPVPKDLPMDKYFTTATDIYLMMAFGLLVAPVMEEIFFRGLVFPVAVRHVGLAIGSAITALLFALIHQGQLAHAWAPLALLFGVGLALTAIRAVTKSVAASWITHVSYNATLFALLIYATDGLKHLERMN